MSFLHYILLALYILFVNRIPSPRDFILSLATNLPNLLDPSLTLVLCALETGLPHLCSHYTEDVESYCWYVIHWMWVDRARVAAWCVLFASVAIAVFVYPRVLSCCQGMIEAIKRIEATTRTIHDRLEPESAWTDEEIARVVELAASEDEAAHARIRSFVQERSARREQRTQESITMTKENAGSTERNDVRVQQSSANPEEQRAAELRHEKGSLPEDETPAVDRGGRLPESATEEYELRYAEAQEINARQQAVIEDLQERVATEEEAHARLRDKMEDFARKSVEMVERRMLRAATAQAKISALQTAYAGEVDPASHSETKA